MYLKMVLKPVAALWSNFRDKFSNCSGAPPRGSWDLLNVFLESVLSMFSNELSLRPGPRILDFSEITWAAFKWTQWKIGQSFLKYSSFALFYDLNSLKFFLKISRGKKNSITRVVKFFQQVIIIKLLLKILKC